MLDKLAAVQMLDVHFPTTDGRTLVLTRYTELNADQKILAQAAQPRPASAPAPRITAAQADRRPEPPRCSGDLAQPPLLISLAFFVELRKSG